jgi:hypothetical protein
MRREKKNAQTKREKSSFMVEVLKMVYHSSMGSPERIPSLPFKPVIKSSGLR